MPSQENPNRQHDGPAAQPPSIDEPEQSPTDGYAAKAPLKRKSGLPLASKPMTRYERASLTVTVFGIIVGIGVLVVYSLQLREMKESTRAATASVAYSQAAVNAARDAAAAAENSASAADKQVEYGAIQANAARSQIALTEDSLRARLAITEYQLKPLMVGEHPTMLVYIENVGHSAATDQRNATVSMCLPALLPADLAGKSTDEIMAGIKTEPWFLHIVVKPTAMSAAQLALMPYLPPSATFRFTETIDPTVLEPGGKSTHICRYAKPLTASLLQDIQNNTRRLFFFGYSSYVTFGKRHVTRFCGYTFPLGGEDVRIGAQPLMACGGKWNSSE